MDTIASLCFIYIPYIVFLPAKYNLRKYSTVRVMHAILLYYLNKIRIQNRRPVLGYGPWDRTSTQLDNQRGPHPDQPVVMLLLGLILCLSLSQGKRTVIITGGNRGIGYSAVRQLAETNDWSVVMACRDLQRGRAALIGIPVDKGRDNVEVQQLDLASLASIADFCSRWKENRRDLHVLACNAGVQHSGSKDIPLRTKDGFEDTVGTNHIGHFLLTCLLTSSLSKEEGRIVFVGSGHLSFICQL